MRLLFVSVFLICCVYGLRLKSNLLNNEHCVTDCTIPVDKINGRGLIRAFSIGHTFPMRRALFI